jgi:diguanylate cyclase (GGDEF)-like protein/PAS domain S-box-containing protein
MIDQSESPDHAPLSRIKEILEQNAAAFLARSPQEFYISDLNGRLVWMSDRFCQTLGFTREELYLLPPSRWDRLWNKSDWNLEGHGISDSPDRTFESTWQAKNGRLVLVEITRTRLDLEGESFLYCVARDISLRKEEQSLSKNLFDFNLLLGQANQLIADARDENGFLQRLCDLALEFGHLSLIWISHPDNEGWLQIKAASGAVWMLEDLRLSVRPEIPEGQGPSGISWRTGTPHFDFDFQKLSETTPISDWRNRILQSDFRSSGFIPLHRTGKLWGLLCVYHREENAFDAELQCVLEEIARNFSRGLDRIDERKRDHDLQEFQKALIDNTLSGIMLLKNRQIIHVNQRLIQMMGYDKPEELIGQSGRILYSSEEEFSRIGSEVYPRLFSERTVFLSDLQGCRKNGDTFWVDVSASLIDPVEKDPIVVVTFQDVTLRHSQTERLKRLSDFNSLLAQANQTISRASDETSLLQSICEHTIRYAHLSLAWIGKPGEDGWFRTIATSSSQKDLGMPVLSCNPDIPEGQGPAGITWRSGKPHAADTLESLFPSSSELSPDFRITLQGLGLRSGATLPIFRGDLLWAVFGLFDSREHTFGSELLYLLEEFARDISRGLDKLDAQSRERNLRDLQEALLDNTVSGIMMAKERSIIHVNSRLIEMFGYDGPEEFLGRDSRFLYPDQTEYERIGAALYPRIYDHPFVSISDVRGMKKNGDILWIDLSVTMIGGSQGNTIVATLQDVTDRHQQTEHLKRLSDFNSLLAEARQVIAVTSDEVSLLQTLCDLAVKYGHVDIAWIGQPDDAGWFEIMVSSGMTEALDGLRLSIDPGFPEGLGSAGIAWRTGAPHYNFSLAYPEEHLIPPSWRPALLHYGLRSTAVLPLMREGKQWAVISILDRQRNAFDSDLQDILGELARSISQGLERIDLLKRERKAASINRAITDNALAGFALTDPENRSFLYLNSYILRTLGYPEDFPVNNQSGNLFLANEDEVHRLEVLYQEIRKHGEAAALNVRLRHRDGHIIPFDLYGRSVGDPQSNTVLWTCVEATERSRLQERIEHEATHDPLTELPNRRGLEQDLARSLARARRAGTGLALGILDIDDFKYVNDSFGHAAGDRLLREFSARVRFLLRENDFVARLGGDEFVVVLEDLDPGDMTQMVGSILDRLHQSVETPFEVFPGQTVSVGITLGVALFPVDGDGADLLLRQADLAMYQLKERKHQRSRWWQRGLHENSEAPPEEPFDAFGPLAKTLVERCKPLLDQTSVRFGESFYARLSQEPEANDILSSLSENDLQDLKKAQIKHLCFLLAPQTTQAMIGDRAVKMGEIHALVGVGPTLLFHAKNLYNNLLIEQINRTPLSVKDRYQLLVTFENRLNEDIQTQLESQSRTIDIYFDIFKNPLPPPGTLWNQARDREMAVLKTLPGLIAPCVLHPDSQGKFVMEPSPSGVGEEQPPSPPGPVREIFSGITGSWNENSPLILTSDARDNRSSAFLPFGIRNGRPWGVLCLRGSMPHQFSSAWSSRFLLSLRRRWEDLWSTCHIPPSLGDRILSSFKKSFRW